MKEKIKFYRDNVHKKLIFRQRLFLLIALVLLIISIINIASGKINIILSAGGLLTGTAIGLALSRMFKILWHPEQEKVISRLDTLGVILLVVYIAIDVEKSWIFGHWLSGAILSAFGLIFLTGLLLGRFLGTGFRIYKILADK